MLREKIVLSALLMGCIWYASCGQNEIIDKQEISTAEEMETDKQTERPMHRYGGWYCPDNLGGFPPIDIREFRSIPVITDRLPTEEEARSGRSLMFFDTQKIPEAKPLEIGLPRVAKVYSRHTEMDELVIIIQAAVAKTDSVVGFRYPSGGNGTAWLQDVTFLSDEEVESIAPSPYVHSDLEISASKQEIWDAITSTAHIKELAEKFDENAFFASTWNDESQAHLYLNTLEVRARGIVMLLFGNLYMQVDYDYNGFHFTEKLLLIEDPDEQTAQLQIVSGPYPKDIETERITWGSWLKEVKELSEAN